MGSKFFNNTFSFTLQIARFDVPPEAVYPVFITGTLIYLFSVVCNVTILLLIVTQPRLHKPMFYIMFSLPLADLIGITCALPRVLIDIVTQTNTVYYPACVLQAFFLHLYGGGVLFVLTAMSFDRYIAICKPLRYNSIMTPYTVCGLIALAWGTDLATIVVLFALQARNTNCKTYIPHVLCNNVDLLQLTCGDDLTVNNIYGLFMTGFMHGVSLPIQFTSYILILRACISNSQADARSKALNTCMAQLISLTLFELLCGFTVIASRFETISVNAQQSCGMLIFIILPVVNPVLYGIKTRDIRNTFLIVLKKKTKIVSIKVWNN